MHIDRPPHLMTGDNAAELMGRAMMMGADHAPVFSDQEKLAVRGHAYLVAAFDEEGMTVKPEQYDQRAKLALGDFVKLKGFWFKVVQLRMHGHTKLEPWGWPVGSGGGPPHTSWRERAAAAPVAQVFTQDNVRARPEDVVALHARLERHLAGQAQLDVDLMAELRKGDDMDTELAGDLLAELKESQRER